MRTFIITFTILINIGISAQPLFLEQNSGVTTPLNYAFGTGWTGPNVVVAWICGNNGVVLKTTSSGGTWINVHVPDNINLNTILSMPNNSLKAFTAGVKSDTAIIYRTTNAGTNWQIVFRQYQGNINAIFFTDSNAVIVGNPVGARWSIWKSANEGLTWDSTGLYLARNGTENGFNNSFTTTVLQGHIYLLFGTNNYRVYYSSNRGNSWSVMPIPNEQNIYALNFPAYYSSNELLGYAAGGSKVYFTTNTGANWIETTPSPGTGIIHGLVACPLPVTMLGFFDVLITRNDGNVYRNPSYSSSWIPAYTAPLGIYRYISNQPIYVGYSLYAVRDNGGISWGSCGTGGIQRISNEIPIDFALKQNYPNPFNPVTKIRFDVPKDSKIRISVFDVLGKEVARLAEQYFQPGQYELTWDAANYTSGVYFYSMIANDYSVTKKMVLVK
jgi:hypothetical protein